MAAIFSRVLCPGGTEDLTDQDDPNESDVHHLMVGAGIIERKLRSTKVRLFTVPCCSIILFSSEGVKKKRT